MFKKLGLVVAAAAIMFSAGLGLATSANAQTPPATFYGKGLKSGDKVGAWIGGKVCAEATANAAGEWSISVPSTMSLVMASIRRTC